jgi:hypothetical protein
MREPTFLILTSPAAGARHGYGIMTHVAQISDGRIRLRARTAKTVSDLRRVLPDLPEHCGPFP